MRIFGGADYHSFSLYICFIRGVSEKTRTQCTPYGKKFYPQNTEEHEINKDTYIIILQQTDIPPFVNTFDFNCYYCMYITQ